MDLPRQCDRPEWADRDAQAAIVAAFDRQEGRLIMIDAHDSPHLASFRRQAVRAGMADGIVDLDADLPRHLSPYTHPFGR